MAEIKKLIEQLRSKLNDQQRAELGNSLSVIESEFLKMATELESAKADYDEKDKQYREVLRESIQRKNKIKTIEEELESFKNDKTSENLKKELEDLKMFKTNIRKKQRESFIQTISQLSKHPKIGEAIKIFAIPENAKNEKGELQLDSLKPEDWSKISDDQMEKNIVELEKLQTINYFEAPKPSVKQIIPGQRQTVIKPEHSEPIKSKADLKQKIADLTADYNK